ncbi:MAG: nicotinate-nucleotide--dimethylbenzimidazole phosphoribosyltransferase [Actinomycetota bacterium]
MTGRTSAADQLAATMAEAPAPDRVAAEAVAARAAEVLRPAGALARLDELAVWLAAWQRTTTPTVAHPAGLIFAGDHGVAAEGVSAYPAEVTGAMMAACAADKASISALARAAGATATTVDVGVGRPTANLRTEPAMDHDRFAEAVEIGRRAVTDLDPAVDLLVIGELGIGNTTAAAAVTAGLLDQPASRTVGGGTGVTGEALAAKVAVVDEAVARARADGAGPDEPLEVLRHLGGTELAAMTGAVAEARRRSLAVLLDGYVTAAPALVAARFDPRCAEHLRAGHGSAEQGHRLLLDALELEPLLDLGLRLGEGSGAMAAVPLVRMGCALVTEVPTFAEWFGPGDDAGDG